ncbi:MAG: hypothetical protein JWO80_1551, partial [Bryobacterales bacterium]|nr:hypothetical protein [Bryobacterales bacterium]
MQISKVLVALVSSLGLISAAEWPT